MTVRQAHGRIARCDLAAVERRHPLAAREADRLAHQGGGVRLLIEDLIARVVEQLFDRLFGEAFGVDARSLGDRRVRCRDGVEVEPGAEHGAQLGARGRRRDQALGVRPHLGLAVERVVRRVIE